MFGAPKKQSDITVIPDAELRAMLVQTGMREKKLATFRKAARGILVVASMAAVSSLFGNYPFAIILLLGAGHGGDFAADKMALHYCLAASRKMEAIRGEMKRRDDAADDFNTAAHEGVRDKITVSRPLRLRKSAPSL